jgi:hypothetical protein
LSETREQTLEQLMMHMEECIDAESKFGDEIYHKVVGMIGYAANMHAKAHQIIETVTEEKLPFNKGDAIAYSAFIAGLSLSDEDPAMAMQILRDINRLSNEHGIDSLSVLIGVAAARIANKWRNS